MVGLFITAASTTLKTLAPTAITVGDVNGDGFADVVMVGRNTGAIPLGGLISASANEVIVLLGNGKGGFLTSSSAAGNVSVSENTYSVSPLLSTSSVAVGDFDGDHYTDVAVLGQTNGLAAGATVQSQTAIDVLWDVTKPALTPVIGKLAVISSPVSTNTLITPASNPNVNTLLSGDLDGDGRSDLVAALSSQAAIVPISAVVPLKLTIEPQ